jgi:hypothetical protein
MQAKHEIRAKSLVNNIRVGFSNLELMEKYSLSSKGLLSAFNKLIASKAMKEDELGERLPTFDETVDINHAREFPRCYMALGLPIYDKEDSEAEYDVVDLTEKGVQVGGIAAKVGDKKSLIIKAGGLDQRIKPCAFDAECRWVKEDSQQGSHIAGFEITDITDSDLEVLLHIIKLLTFCDE